MDQPGLGLGLLRLLLLGWLLRGLVGHRAYLRCRGVYGPGQATNRRRLHSRPWPRPMIAPCWRSPSPRPSSGWRRRHPDRGGAGGRRPRSWAPGTTAGSSWAAPSAMARPMRWRSPGGSRHRSTGGRPWSPPCRHATCAPARSCCTRSRAWSSARTETFMGGEELLRSRGVEVVVLDDPECVAMMEAFIAEQPEPLERGHRRVGDRKRRVGRTARPTRLAHYRR